MAIKSGFVKAVAVAAPSVVSIQGEKQYDAGESPRTSSPGRTDQGSLNKDGVTHIGMGTGVVIDERGYIVTNYHVVKGLLKIQITTHDGTIYRDVEFIRNDLKTDLALIKINPEKPLKKIRMGKLREVELAEDVIAIGNPFGYQASISRGIVSGLHRPLKASETLSYDDVIQTDAAINPGNSGGPLININGEMIGLNAAVREGAENIAFAIPVDIVAETVEEMISRSVAKMKHHGLKFATLEPGEEGYPAEGDGFDCVRVESVVAGSPAESAGLVPGDIVLNSNGLDIHSSLDFTCSLINVTVMDSVKMRILRSGQEEDAVLAFAGTGQGENALVAFKANRPETKESGEVVSDAGFQLAQSAPSYAADDSHDNTTHNEAGTAISQTNVNPRAIEVRTRFGVEVSPVSAEEYKQLYPHLTVVSLGESKIYPAGGVKVTDIDPASIFQVKSEKIRVDDLIFGIVVGDKPENRWGITSCDDLYYVADRWEDFIAEGNTSLRVYLIRGETPYFLDVELK